MWKQLVHIPPPTPLQTVATMALQDDNGNPGKVNFFFSRSVNDIEKGILRAITMYAIQYFLINKSSTKLANIWRKRYRLEVKFRVDSNPKFAGMSRVSDMISFSKGARVNKITWTVPINDVSNGMVTLSMLAHSTWLYLKGELKFRGWASRNGQRVYRYQGQNHFKESNEEPWIDDAFGVDFFHAVPGFFDAIEEGSE